MIRAPFSYSQSDLPTFLRKLADRIEAMDEQPDTAVLVYGELGGTAWVEGAGENGSIESVGMLRMGEHILLNALMPFGASIQATTNN